MKKLVAAAAIAVLGLTAGANAADLSTRMPVKAAPMVAPAYNWTGFYLGLGGGYGSFDIDSRTLVDATGGVISDNGTVGGRGWFGTVQGGFDYQFAPNWLAGVFADFDFSDIKGTAADHIFSANHSMKQRWAWAVGARFGYLLTPQALAYIDGGYTQARFDGGDLVSSFANVPIGLSVNDETFNGWFIGAGAEVMIIPSWFVKGEYRFAQYDSENLPVVVTGVGVPIGLSESLKPSVQTFRVELSYKFNWFH